MSSLQFVDPRFQFASVSPGALFLRLQLLLGSFQFLTQFAQPRFQLIAMLADFIRLLFSTFPALAFLRQRLAQPLDLLLQFELRRLQFFDARLEFALIGSRTSPFCLKLFLRLFEFMAQMTQLDFQLTAPFFNLAGPLFRNSTTSGFIGQGFGKLPGFLLGCRARRLYFASRLFERALLNAGTFLLCLQFFLRDFELFAQVTELCFQLAAAFANLVRLLLSTFAAFRLLSQGFGQPFNLFLYIGLCCLKFFDARPELRLLGARTLLLPVQLLLRSFQLFANLAELGLQLGAAFAKVADLLLCAFSTLALLGKGFG